MIKSRCLDIFTKKNIFLIEKKNISFQELSE